MAIGSFQQRQTPFQREFGASRELVRRRHCNQSSGRCAGQGVDTQTSVVDIDQLHACPVRAQGESQSTVSRFLDGWVLARSHFSHSANYRSVVVFGRARSIDDPERKASVLAHLVDALIPGRAADSRPSDAQELAATSLLEIEIEDCSVKTRSGPPKDHPDDLGWPTWAGVIPLALTPGKPEPAPNLESGYTLPDYWVVKPNPAL